MLQQFCNSYFDKPKIQTNPEGFNNASCIVETNDKKYLVKKLDSRHNIDYLGKENKINKLLNNKAPDFPTPDVSEFKEYNGNVFAIRNSIAGSSLRSILGNLDDKDKKSDI